jgi:hypothetical protein
MKKAKPLKKLPRDNEDCLSYLARLAVLMATGNVKGERYPAARLEEAQLNEVTTARELLVICE